MQICGSVRVAWWDRRARAGVVEGGGYVVERVDVVLLLLRVRREGREGRLMVESRGVLEVVEVVEERAGARNRLVSETAMVHGVVVLLVPPPITLSLCGRSPVGAGCCDCAHASGVWSEQDLRIPRDHRCSMRAAGGGVHGWRVGRRGRSTLMRWQARGLAGLGLQRRRGGSLREPGKSLGEETSWSLRSNLKAPHHCTSTVGLQAPDPPRAPSSLFSFEP
jgi:hypothetical protein